VASISQEAPKRWRINGWKLGFFVALFAFEVAREWAVLASSERPLLATVATVTSGYGLVTADGRWTRIDGGEKLAPTAVAIKCWRDRKECTETSVQLFEGTVMAPETDTFPAEFSPDAVTYENTQPLCVRYWVRIDLRLKKVIGVRERTDNKSADCGRMEPRVEMQLGNGYDPTDNPTDKHFVPVFQLLGAVLKLL
jgi:hypothetical protein